MINPHTKTGEDLAHVAEHLAAWPMNTDFVHVKSGVIHMIEGGSSSAVSYINREQWAAAKTLHQYWFPEKQPKPEGFCDVCGDIHCIHEMYPGICAEYDAGMVSLDLAKAIYNGDFRHENAEDSMNKTSDLVHRSIICPEHGLQDGLTFCPDCLADQASAREDELSRRAQIDICNQVGAFAAEDEFLAPEIGVVESFLGSPFSTPEEDEAFAAIEKKQERYQDAQGEDWIDEAARTFTAEEFRGAMRFSIGKYNRRMGKKDDLIIEIEKMRDYCSRWLEVEVGR